ncbi:hypothetical protein JCM10908_003367 [Rhodotorula pacifica]|uniref:uncharacterized protein n=1 Tax=Rhodotorula pacifica TaxID=1495444 RepID=UPI00317572E8
MAQQHTHVAQYGFNAPSPIATSSSATAAAGHHHHQQQQQGLGASASANVDPAILFGYSSSSTAGMLPPLAGGVGMYGSSSVLSDADLDFENILASLNNAAAAPHGGGGAAGLTQQGYMGGGGSTHLRHQSPLPPVNENGGQPPSDRTDYYAQRPPKPRRSSTNEFGTPNTNTSYGASPSDTFTTPSTSSKRSVSQERTGRLGRSSSSNRNASGGVGKAPRQTSRSRSARRTSSAATAGYQDAVRSEAKDRGRDRERSTQRAGGGGGVEGDKASPASNLGTPANSAATPGASGGGAVSAPPPAAATPGAIGIPAPNPAMAAAHPYAMSMPGFVHPATFGVHAASMPTHPGGWFPPPHPAAAGAFPPPHGMHPGLAAAGGAFASPHFMPHHHPGHPMAFDPLTGWRPTVGPMAASAPPAAAPSLGSSSSTAAVSAAPAGTASTKAHEAPAPATSSKKNKGLEDVQEEDDGKGEHLTDKRRKRRESHNAVERRRRDNINDRISELASLLPEAFQVGAAPPPFAAAAKDDLNAGPGSPAIGSLSLMSPGPSGAAAPAAVFGSASPTSFHSVSGGAYMSAAAAQKAAASGLSAQAQAAANKPNKGAVLAKSVDYIRYLQQVVELQQQQAVELQRQNAELRRAVELATSPSPPSSHSLSHSNYLPPQPPCFPPHVHSASVSTSTSASVSRQAGSPVGTRAGNALPPPSSSGLGLLSMDESTGSSMRAVVRNGNGRRKGSRSGREGLYGGQHPGEDRSDLDDDDDFDDEREDLRDRNNDDDDEAFTPECEGPDGIDCEKGWDAMLAAGGMHVLKMEEDDP